MSDDLKVMFPDEVVEVAGGPVTVHPFYFGQLSRVAKFCKPIAETLLSSGIMTISSNTDNTSTIKINNDFVPKMFQIMAEGSEPLIALVAYAVDKPREWLDKVPIDEGIKLTQKVWEVNSDFFVKRVMPILQSQLTKSGLIGGMSSPASSEMAIDVKTSTDTP